MNMVALDTLAYAKRLQEAGVPPAQAEAHAVAQADFLTHYLLSEVATKTDLAGVKSELKDEIAELKADMATKADLAELRSELKADMATKSDLAELKAELKTDMAEMETRLTLRMMLMVGVLATLMTVFKFMV